MIRYFCLTLDSIYLLLSLIQNYTFYSHILLFFYTIFVTNRGSGVQSPPSHCGSPGSFLGHSVWDLWCIYRRWYSQDFGYFCQCLSSIFISTVPCFYQKYIWVKPGNLPKRNALTQNQGILDWRVILRVFVFGLKQSLRVSLLCKTRLAVVLVLC